MKIIGVGLNKTGTTSLANALTELGFPCIHSVDIGMTDLAAAVVDTPAAARFKELDVMYPGSKFILTVRDKESWLESCRQHWSRIDLAISQPRVRFEYSWCRVKLYGRTDFDAANHSICYDQHIRDVNEYFAHRESDLLRINIIGGDGWQPLCQFLGVSVPNIPFPRLNQRPPESTQAEMGDRKQDF